MSMPWFFESIAALLVVFLFFAFSLSVEGSVHRYSDEKFVSKGNAFVVHGGSEGIYAPTHNGNGSDAYIR